MRIKQLHYHKRLRFCYGFPGAKSFWDVRETGPRLRGKVVEIESYTTKALKKNHALSVRRKKNAIRRKKRHTSREKKQLLHGWVISRSPRVISNHTYTKSRDAPTKAKWSTALDGEGREQNSVT